MGLTQAKHVTTPNQARLNPSWISACLNRLHRISGVQAQPPSSFSKEGHILRYLSSEVCFTHALQPLVASCHLEAIKLQAKRPQLHTLPDTRFERKSGDPDFDHQWTSHSPSAPSCTVRCGISRLFYTVWTTPTLAMHRLWARAAEGHAHAP